MIELLIAVTLVALLSMGMLFAMRTGLGALSTTKSRLNDNRRVLSIQRILEQQILGVIPVAAKCGGGDGAGVRVAFFQGTPETMRFATSYSMDSASRGYPRIVELQVIPGERAGVRLVVNEYPYTGPESAGASCTGVAPPPVGPQFSRVQIGPGSFVLADRLAFCRFFFRDLAPNKRDVKWAPSWSNIQLFPTGVRIEMAPLEADPARIPLETITVPIRLTRNVLAKYPDE